MMNSIATYKESLSRITSEVFDAAEELDISQSRREDTPASGRRISQRSARFTSPVASSPIANGARTDSGSFDEIAKYKADIQRLQATEAELKAFSSSYAAMLKEKEEQLSKLREENGSLKKSLDGKESVGNVLRDESTRAASNNFKATVDRAPIRSHKNASHSNSRSASHSLKTSPTKKEGFGNGSLQGIPFESAHQAITNSQGNEKELRRLLDEIKSLNALQADHESEIKQLRAQLDSEHEHASAIKLKLQEERHLNESSQRELQQIKIEKERTSNEMKELQKELRDKILELKQLQTELSRKDKEESDDSLEDFKNVISVLENENAKLKLEKSELEASLKLHMMSASRSTGADDLNAVKLNEKAVEEMESSLRKMERTLEDTCKERDKAVQELNRLKQHLLEKELEDSDKMDEDSKTIEELRTITEYQQARILQLENVMKQEVARMEDIKKSRSDELQKANETITELKQKLTNCMNIVDSKNIELQNLQTALGQYYAESEAKERLGRDLAATRDQLAKLFDSLKAANQELEVSKREQEDLVLKLSHTERMLSEGKRAIQKLEEDNSKLRRALEQNMSRLNRMSMDSDNYVDRRIVIKLLVTYFQRNHSKEVLDLMVRMLGFSEEEKQRIGVAQHAAAGGKGVVRGVLGFPGRLVGGILGGSSHEPSSQTSDNQSFADLWVDFLLKETEERERRESEEAARLSSSFQERKPTTKSPTALNIPTPQFPSSILPSRPFQHLENSDSEFATVPLTSPYPNPTRSDPSGMLPRY